MLRDLNNKLKETFSSRESEMIRVFEEFLEDLDGN